MQSRRDQVQAQAYLNGRMVSALLSAEPDAPEPPTRRTSVGLFAGAGVMALVMAGFAVWGLISPGGERRLRTPDALIVESETGTRYVYHDGLLWPVLNEASARLLLGGRYTTTRMSRRALADRPRGRPLGIVGAPDPVPEPRRLTRDEWRVCATVAPGVGGRPDPAVILSIGALPAEQPAGDDEGMLARGPDGSQYLVWRGRRLRVTEPWVAKALAFDSRPPLEASAAWLNAVPAGPDLVPPAVANRGAPGPFQLDGAPTRIGQVFVVRNAGTEEKRYVLLGDGLAALSKLDAALLMADPASPAAYPDRRPRELPLSVSGQVSARTAAMPAAQGRPTDPPRPVVLDGSRVPCLAAAPRTDGVSTRLLLTGGAVAAPRVAAGPAVTVDRRVADRVAVPPGSGVLARPLVAPGVPGVAFYLITDQGVKYPVPSEQDVTALGYGGVAVMPVPPQLLDLLPTGPSLSVEAAGR